MPQAYCAPDRMTAFSRLSRFGMTCAPLTDDRGAALLTWYRAAFPVRTSAPPARAQDSTASAPVSGWKWPASSVKYDPATRSWKTRQCSLLGDSDAYSETWPRWGSMRDGECWPLPTSVPRTCESESGLWPTPNVPNGGRRVPDDAEIRGASTPTAYKNGKKMQVGLEQAVRWWPTPTVVMTVQTPEKFRARQERLKDRHKGRTGNGCGPSLAQAVAMWPTPHGFSKDGRSNGPSGNELGRAVNRSMFSTPTASDCKSGVMSEQAKAKRAQHPRGEKLSNEIGGSLNPTWVEWLMGWPLGWTDLKPLATDRCPCAPPKRGGS